MTEFGPKNLGSDIDPQTGNFIKTPEVPAPIEAEAVETDISRLFADGSAAEYIEVAGAIPIEGILESQGNESTWPELPEVERVGYRQEFSRSAAAGDYRVVEDETSLMAEAA